MLDLPHHSLSQHLHIWTPVQSNSVGMNMNLGLGIGGMSQAAALARWNQAMDALDREQCSRGMTVMTTGTTVRMIPCSTELLN